MSARAAKLAGVALALTPVIVAVLFIHAYAVNVPFWDEWEAVGTLSDFLEGRLTLSDLWQQHNEHRLLFPRLVLLAIGRATAMDSRASMYAAWAILVLGAMLLVADHLRHGGHNGFALVPLTCLLFSLRQFENLLWGWQLQIALCSTTLILAMFLLGRSQSLFSLAGAVIAGWVCSFSFSNGLLVWPVGLLHLRATAPTNCRRTAAAWGAAGIAAAAAYFHGWERPPNHPSPLFLVQHPDKAIGYFLASIGGSLFPDLGAAQGAGAVLLILGAIVAWLWWNGQLAPSRSMAPALIAFSLASSAVIAAGRAGFGSEQALSSRYVTFTVLGVSGLYLLLADNLPRTWPPLTALVSVIAVGQIAGMGAAVAGAKQLRTERREMARILLNHRHEPDENLLKLFPDATTVRAGAEALEKHHLSVFANGSPPLGGRP